MPAIETVELISGGAGQFNRRMFQPFGNPSSSWLASADDPQRGSGMSWVAVTVTAVLGFVAFALVLAMRRADDLGTIMRPLDH